VPSTASPANPYTGASPEALWVPGPVDLPAYGDVLLGKLMLPFGPRRIQLTHAPVKSVQITLNAVLRYDMGFMPNAYIIEGLVNGGDPAAMQLIVAQFGDDPISSIPFIVPIMSIADMVTLTLWQPYMDANSYWKEPFYHLEMDASAGGYTDLVAGVAPVQ
jgi:hypothetical protein